MTDYPFDAHWPPARRSRRPPERTAMQPMPPLVAQFLTWCEDELASHRKSLAMMRAGDLRLHSQTLGQPMRDMTDEAMAHDERIIGDMTALIAKIHADYGLPAAFQTRVDP